VANLKVISGTTGHVCSAQKLQTVIWEAPGPNLSFSQLLPTMTESFCSSSFSSKEYHHHNPKQTHKSVPIYSNSTSYSSNFTILFIHHILCRCNDIVKLPKNESIIRKGTGKTTKSLRIADAAAEIRTEYVQSIRIMYYCQ